MVFDKFFQIQYCTPFIVFLFLQEKSGNKLPILMESVLNNPPFVSNSWWIMCTSQSSNRIGEGTCCYRGGEPETNSTWRPQTKLRTYMSDMIFCHAGKRFANLPATGRIPSALSEWALSVGMFIFILLLLLLLLFYCDASLFPWTLYGSCHSLLWLKMSLRLSEAEND